MPGWQIATALSIILLLGLGTHIFYRRPPSVLWPSLPLAFGAALLFSVGDLIANQWPDHKAVREVGMFLAYTGLLCITPAWWVFSCRFSQISGYSSVCSRFDVRWLIGINAILWVALLTNPIHGAFFESHPESRSSYGPLWYLTAAVNYLALLGTVILHSRGAFLEKDPTIRSHCRFLVGAILIPLILNMTYVMSPFVLSYDPTALGFAISSAILLYAVRKRGLFTLEQVSLPSLLNTDLDAIVIISRYRRILYANPAAEAFFGSSFLQAGASVDPLFEASATTFRLPEPSRTLPITEPSDHLVTSPSGEEKWFVIETSGVIESSGRQVGVCLRLRDQTALRNAHREGARRLGLLEAIGQSSGNGLLVEDDSGQITYTNQALRTMWGLAEESIPTHTDQLAQVLSDQIGSLPAPHRLFDAETFGPRTGFATQSADCTLTDGRILEVQTFRVSTPHGLEGRTWRFIDVTKPRAETQLMIQNQKLEGLGILADGIAHEFNNLLATIVGNAELIRENLDDDADSSTSLEELEGAALQASERTRQLIAYAGKASFERETINLGELVREVGELSAVSFPGHVKLDFRLHPNLPLVRAGAPELRQVVMNFLMNSADALGEKPGTITVTSGIGQPDRMPHAEASVEYGDPADVGLYVQVSDDGCGINPLVINQVFDPFFTTKFAGRGLGLAASRGILESHSASFRVESILGIGSRFSFLLPLNSDSDQ
ncbi:MAG: hypothetical protein CBC48_20435 [bacterium TMED88]|nr:hypothetical protein [Deltaproteobacteria bacterium]OUV21528.1 MAG: hypothetical protein CBC48_20435 [bacterium TMED88]